MSERASRYRTISRLREWSAGMSIVLSAVGIVDMVNSDCRPHAGGTALVGGLVLCVASTVVGAYGAIQARTAIAWTICLGLALLTSFTVLCNFVLMLRCSGI